MALVEISGLVEYTPKTVPLLGRGWRLERHLASASVARSQLKCMLNEYENGLQSETSDFVFKINKMRYVFLRNCKYVFV